MDKLLVFRLIVDFGLLVLIWVVQLVIYPSFKYYKRTQLLEWHRRYTLQITYIVLPLMLSQLLLSGIQLWKAITWYSGSSFLIVILLWVSTFLQFVPLHNKIANDNFNEQILGQLVKKNWLRTILWMSLFLISVVYLAYL